MLPIEPIDIPLTYPVFTVLSVEPSTGERWFVFVEADANDCLPVFRTRELAELYIEQSQEANPLAALEVLSCTNAKEFEQVLTQLASTIDHVIWDAPLRPPYFKLVTVADLLEIVRRA